jgi:hypothetical protein
VCLIENGDINFFLNTINFFMDHILYYIYIAGPSWSFSHDQTTTIMESEINQMLTRMQYTPSFLA